MERRYDPDERFKIDADPEDVLRKLLGVEPGEEFEPEEGEEPES